ncbi:MAG: small multi-drug export protein [Thermoplasmata archaeon]|nr:MAG: small multi-drug export protein [Thermoplasmata archaeon]
MMLSTNQSVSNNDESTDFRKRAIELGGWFAGFVFLFFVIPGILIVALPPSQKAKGLTTLVATPAIEYLAISVGIGLGVDPVVSFFLTFLPCTGLCMLSMGLLGFLRDSSPRIIRFLDKVQKRIERHPKLKNYGIVSNFLFVMFLGVYIAPGIAIILGWSRARSVIFMVGGIALITALIGLGTLGIIDLLFL